MPVLLCPHVMVVLVVGADVGNDGENEGVIEGGVIGETEGLSVVKHVMYTFAWREYE